MKIVQSAPNNATRLKANLVDATEIFDRDSVANTLRDLPDLIQDLESAHQDLLFDTLFPYAVKKQGVDQGPFAFSAYIIHAINPPCSLTPCAALSEMVQHEWDINIEQVTWYLANQFGADRILSCVADALDEQTSRTARARLKTVRYWVGRKP